MAGEASGALGWLGVRDAETAWSDFLRDYAPVVLQVVHLFERDADRRSDCIPLPLLVDDVPNPEGLEVGRSYLAEPPD